MIDVLKKMRGDMFPEIEDWSGDQNHLRESSAADLGVFQFIWFHPIAFVTLKLGIPFQLFVLGVIFSIKNAKYGISFNLGIPLLITIGCIIWMFAIVRKLDVLLKMNLYDMLLRDN